MESDSELLFQGGENREKRLEDLLLVRFSTGLDRPELEAVVEPEAQNNEALSREPVLLAAPALWACSIWALRLFFHSWVSRALKRPLLSEETERQRGRWALGTSWGVRATGTGRGSWCSFLLIIKFGQEPVAHSERLMDCICKLC